MSVKQPLMQQRMMLRFAIGLLIIAGLLIGWFFLKGYLQDPDSGFVDTTGWIAVIKQNDSGSQAMLIKPTGEVVSSPDYAPGNNDRDLVWQPDGERLYFSSDRDKEAKGFHIYRWNPAQNAVTERSAGKLSQAKPIFQEQGGDTPPYQALVISGGRVVDFDPKDKSSHQVLPVVGNAPTQVAEEPGSGSEFGPEYSHLGDSYVEAHFCKGGKYIVAIMHRDEGECLVIQCLQAVANGTEYEDGLPHGVVAGDHIDLSIDPANGNVAFAVQDFQFIDSEPDKIPKQFIKGGKAIKPYQNAIGFLDPDHPDTQGLIVGSVASTDTFLQPAISPDGKKVLFVYGAQSANGFQPVGLGVVPFLINAGQAVTPIYKGGADNPSWSPDGSQIVFVDLAHRDVCTIKADGSGFRNLTNGSGSYAQPKFSPRMPKPGS